MSEPQLLAVRLGPGEEVVAALRAVVQDAALEGAAVAAAAGSLREVVYALAAVDADGHTTYGPTQVRQGPIELVSLSGHLGRTQDRAVAFHLHGAFALSDGTLVGGHLFSARTLATIEITLVSSEGTAWTAVPYDHRGRAPADTYLMSPSQPAAGR